MRWNILSPNQQLQRTRILLLTLLCCAAVSAGGSQLWAKEVDSVIKKNFGLANEALENLQNREMPLDLLESAYKKLEAIDIDSPAFLNEEKVLVAVDKVRKIADSYKTLILKYRKNSK